MNNKKSNYIQLPPIPRDTDGKTVQMMWEYAKLDEEAQKVICKQYGVPMVNDTEEMDWPEQIEAISAEKLEPFRKNMMEMVAQITKETSILAEFVMSECIVLERDVTEVMNENPQIADKILGMYRLFTEKMSCFTSEE